MQSRHYSKIFKSSLVLFIAGGLLIAVSPDASDSSSNSAAPTPLADTLGAYSPTEYLVNSINSNLEKIKQGAGIVTPGAIALKISGSGAASGDVTVTAFSILTFKGTYDYIEETATFVFSQLSGKTIPMIDKALGEGAFNAIAGEFTGANNPLAYINGELKDASGNVLLTRH